MWVCYLNVGCTCYIQCINTKKKTYITPFTDVRYFFIVGELTFWHKDIPFEFAQYIYNYNLLAKYHLGLYPLE